MRNFSQTDSYKFKKRTSSNFQIDECINCEKFKKQLISLEEKTIKQSKIIKNFKEFHEESEKTFDILEKDHKILKIQINDLSTKNLELNKKLLLSKSKRQSINQSDKKYIYESFEIFDEKLRDSKNMKLKLNDQDIFYESKIINSLNEQKKILNEEYNKKLNESLYNYELKIEKMEKLLVGKFSKDIRMNKNFIETICCIVKEFHPDYFFKNKEPSLKYIWKWFKLVIEKYFKLKQDFQKNEKIIEKLKILFKHPLDMSLNSLETFLDNLIENFNN